MRLKQRLRLAAAPTVALFLLGCAHGTHQGFPLPIEDTECAAPKRGAAETDGGLGGTGHGPGDLDDDCAAPIHKP